MGTPGEYYELGLVHPSIEWTGLRPWLAAPIDLPDADGLVSIPTGPGCGEVLDRDRIESGAVAPWS